MGPLSEERFDERCSVNFARLGSKWFDASRAPVLSYAHVKPQAAQTHVAREGCYVIYIT